MKRALLSLLVAAALLTASQPAAAQWTRVVQVPASDVFSLSADHDTIVAGMDTCVVLSTDGGASWQRSSRITADRAFVFAVRVHNGRIFAGTGKQGVFVSDDGGATWSAFNQGLVGGLFDSQLDVADFALLGNDLHVATFGAGVYERPLVPGGTWQHFGEAFEPNQASNVNALGVGGTRLIAAAGVNGTVFHRDPGENDWTTSFLDNVGLEPGLAAQAVIWNGSGWVVGTNVGVFRSASGQEPWSFTNLGLGPIFASSFATQDRRLFGAFDLQNEALVAISDDDGASWELLDVFPFRFVYHLAVVGDDLYAARADGLFRRSANPVSVVDQAPGRGPSLRVVGRQPVGESVRFRIESPEAGAATIEVFDVTGRRAAEPIRWMQPAGTYELAWNARDLPPGVYASRLTVGDRHSTMRLVHVR